MREFDAGRSADQIDIMQDDDLPQFTASPQPLLVQSSELMYKYRTQNTYNGIPVTRQAQDLLVESTDSLDRALRLEQRPRVFVGHLSQETPEVIKEYEKILQLGAKGTICIQEQLKQFDPAKSAFIVFLKYSELSYTLNPRYKHLAKQERNGHSDHGDA